MIEALGEPIDDWHHGIAIGDRKRAAGAEIVLHIDISSKSSLPGRICIRNLCSDYQTLALDKSLPK